MPLDDWKSDDDDEKSMMELVNDNIVVPLFSAPVQTVQVTSMTMEYVGSRSRVHIDRVKKLSRTILDSHEREKAYGAPREWRKWVDSHILSINGSPLGKEILNNIPSGITVALVYIPLSISLGIAADATPEAGLITATWAVLAAGLFGGSHHNIVGPTGALTGILSKNSIRYGVEVLPLLSIISGVLCLCVFASGLDQCVQFVPLSVVQGFSVGVAFSIAANQLDFALGLPKLPRHERLIDNIAEQIKHIDGFEWQCLTMFLFFFFAQLFFSMILPRIRRVPIPWAVIMAMVGILCGYLSEKGTISYRMQTLATRYPSFSGANVVAPRPLGASLFPPVCEEPLAGDDNGHANETRHAGLRHAQSTLGRLGGSRWPVHLRSSVVENATSTTGSDRPDCVANPTAWFTTCVELFQAALSIAFVAVLETLISAKIAAKITKVKCNQRREVR